MSRPWTPPSREEILETLRSAAGPMTPDELATSLKVLDPAQREILDRRLAAMERDGQLMPNRKGVLLLASNGPVWAAQRFSASPQLSQRATAQALKSAAAPGRFSNAFDKVG